MPPDPANEVQDRIRAAAKARRLTLNIPQADLARRAGVPLPTLKRFEQSGEVALATLLRIAGALDALDGFGALFPPVAGSGTPPGRQRARGPVGK